ncbi:transposase [Streptomyces sp. NPDC059070]|uniref:transposase n=1 Tax=Streptomyces sp. NPDC059070 TaxID=3346713 RepID=UPI003678FEA7
MSLRPIPVPPVPEATARVARAVFRKGCLAMRVRDELGPLFCDEQFASAFPHRGGPALSPGQLAMVSVLQFAEGLTDRQAADAVRSRIDVKYCLGLELDDPGFNFSVLSEFRDRLIVHGLEEQVLDIMLERLSGLGLLRAGGRQRTDATHVLAAVRAVNRMEFVGETMRAALEALAATVPDWLADIAGQHPVWAKRYGARCDSYRMPKGDNAREEWARTVGEDGFALLEAAHAPTAPRWLREIPAVQVLRTAWVQQYHRDSEGVRWREGKDLPPGRIRILSPYDVQARYSVKRGAGWVGYKVHFSKVCEPDAPHVITNVATTDATVQDTEMTDQIHQSLQKRELLPAEHLVHCGYTSASLLVQARDDYHVNLLGPLRQGRFKVPAGASVRRSRLCMGSGLARHERNEAPVGRGDLQVASNHRSFDVPQVCHRLPDQVASLGQRGGTVAGGAAAAVPDPRRRRGVRHPFVAVLLVAASAVVGSAQSFAAIGQWAANAPQHALARLGRPRRRGTRRTGRAECRDNPPGHRHGLPRRPGRSDRSRSRRLGLAGHRRQGRSRLAARDHARRPYPCRDDGRWPDRQPAEGSRQDE